MRYSVFLFVLLLLFIPLQSIAAQRIVVISPVQPTFSYDPEPETMQIWATGVSFFNYGIPVSLKIVNGRATVGWQAEIGYHDQQLHLRFDGKQHLLKLSRSDTYLYCGVHARYDFEEPETIRTYSFDLGIGAILDMNRSYSIGAEGGMRMPIWDESGSPLGRYPTGSLFLLYWL